MPPVKRAVFREPRPTKLCDDEDEDDFVYANISSKNARMVAHERAAALAL
jgi:hypothetical protein